MGDTNYDGGGFHDSDDGVFGDPGQGGGSVSDYDNWDWKQIMAAINGMAAGTDSDSNESHAASVSDPQTLQDAADAFYQVQVTLSGIAKALSDQAKALAGDDGPWKGDAADAFHDMMQTFSKQVQSNADVLGGGSGGGHSVPQQLADNAVNLTNARNKIVDIDNWYANQAVLMGVQPMDNGLIPIHEKPQLVDMMTSDMRAVLKSLAGEYQVTIDSVHSPSGVNSPVGGGDQPPPDTTGGPDVHVPDFQMPDSAPPPTAFNAPNLSGMPFPGSTDTGGPTGFNPSDASQFPGMDSKFSPTPFSGGTGTGGPGSAFPNAAFAKMPGAGDGLGGDGSDLLDPNALDGLLNPNASPTGFPGSTGVGDGTGGLGPMAFSPTGFNSGTSTGGTGKLPSFSSGLSPKAFSSDLPAEDFPGALGTGGAGSKFGAGGTGGIGGLKPTAFPGSKSTESGLPDSLKSPAFDNAALETGGPEGLAAPYTGGTGTGGQGMPMMPGMGGGMGGGAGQGAGGGEPSDASALLDPSAKPWEGDASVGDGDVGSEFGTGAGGEGLQLPGAHSLAAFPGGTATGGQGMPMMPGMGGGMGGGAGQG
ncbi:WXG100 family type VII secretion target, partial [Streptomyces fuscigenes]|uniref:WXG100 family type VII secretion target n=1 Tax=Streptomyces fuscigenes TaxID=1528880 RepID=UPI0022A83E01